MDVEKEILKEGIRDIGEDLLNESEELFRNVSNFIEKLEDERKQLMFGYLYIVKILSCYDLKESKRIIKMLKKVNWKETKEDEL